MKKILLIHTFYNILGGEDVAVQNELKLLKQNYQVETIFFKNKDFIRPSQLITYVFNNNRESVQKVRKKIIEFQPDAIYVHNTWFKASLGIFKLLEEFKIPVYLKLHNFRYDCTRHFLSKNHLNGNATCLKCGFQSKNFQLFNKYFSDSYIKSLIVIRYGKKYFKILQNKNINLLVLTKFHLNFLLSLGLNFKNIFLLHNPINSAKENWNSQKSDYFTYSGRISKEKGVDELISAFLKSSVRKSKLRILGAGPLLDKLKKKYEHNNNIEFLGLVTNEESQKIISQSKAVITFTKLLEGQPMLLCEASSFGVPSVFPDQGGIHEFFPLNSNLSFNHDIENDPVETLNKLSDNDILIREGEKNKMFIDKDFSDKEYIKAFEEIISKNE